MVGEFVISIDYELYWGVYDSMPIEAYRDHIKQVHAVLPEMLDLFDEYDVSATIAFVGLLLSKDLESARNLIPDSMLEKPGIPQRLSDHLKEMKTEKEVNALHFDHGIIDRLIQSDRHELASHSFSHYYCQEPHSTEEDFYTDLNLFKEAVNEKGISFTSFIFPRNQFLNPHLDSINQFGFKVYRGNPNVRFHRKGNGLSRNILSRAVRFLDSYIPVSGDMTSKISKEQSSTIIDIPASLFLRPVTSSSSPLYQLQLRRIKACMKSAAVNKRRFHLWWHPHNFGKNSSANLELLEEILKYYTHLNREYGLQSRTMAESAGFVKA